METLTLDGNALGGALADVFGADLTAALATCAACGATGAIATVRVYVHAPGVVARCPACGAVVLRLTRIRGVACVDLEGLRALEAAGPRRGPA